MDAKPRLRRAHGATGLKRYVLYIMKKIFICTVCGLIGVAVFLLGAASSSGGYFVVMAFPAKLLQYAVLNWGLPLDDVQLNRWGVAAQFLGYFVIALILMQLTNTFTKKHNNSFKSTPKDGAIQFRR